MRTKIPPRPPIASAPPPRYEWACASCRSVGALEQAPGTTAAQLLEQARARHAVIQPSCRGVARLRCQR